MRLATTCKDDAFVTPVFLRILPPINKAHAGRGARPEEGAGRARRVVPHLTSGPEESASGCRQGFPYMIRNIIVC